MNIQTDDALWDRFAGDQGPVEFLKYAAAAGQTIREAVTEGVAEWINNEPDCDWADAASAVVDQLVRYLERAV